MGTMEIEFWPSASVSELGLTRAGVFSDVCTGEMVSSVSLVAEELELLHIHGSSESRIFREPPKATIMGNVRITDTITSTSNMGTTHC